MASAKSILDAVPAAVWVVAGGVVLGLVLLPRAAAAVRDAVGGMIDSGAIDPTSSNNVAARTVDKVGSVLTGEAEFSLGAWIWEKTHAEQVKKETAGLGASGSW